MSNEELERIMYRWNGAHGGGAMRAYRDRKRVEAEERNAATPTARRRKTRMRKYHTGELKPSLASGRDARALRKAQRKTA